MNLRTGTAALGLALLLGAAQGAGAYERDMVEAANAARVSLGDMEELVACLEGARADHPDWSGRSRTDLVQLAFSIEGARTLSGKSGRDGQEDALASCRLLQVLP
jgi:hypothetical protein